MNSLLEKNIEKHKWIETLNRTRREGFTGIAVVYFRNAGHVSKSLFMYKNGEIKNTVYEIEGRIFSGTPSLLLERWYSTCEGVMDLYGLSEDKLEELARNYENLFINESFEIAPKRNGGVLSGGRFLGTLSLSLLSMEEIRNTIHKRQLNGYLECESGFLLFVGGEAFASISDDKKGFSALKEIMECGRGDVRVFELPNIDAVLKVGIPIDAVLVARHEEEMEESLERIKRRIPTEEEIDEIMRQMAFRFGGDQ